MRLPFTPDAWQLKFIETDGDKILCCGRQVGKSEICSIDAAEWAVEHPKSNVLIIAPTERQSFALFNKVLDYLAFAYPRILKKGRDRPTHTRIKLLNGTVIYCLPTGLSGLGVRFMTVHRLYVDEASRVPEPVFTAVTPMLLTTGGATIQLSTPAGPKGYFYNTFINKNDAFKSYTRFSIDSETTVREREICSTWSEQQRDFALQQIEREKARMSNAEFGQEYLGRFVESLHQFFNDELISSVCTLIPSENQTPTGEKYLGVDIARMGEDESTFFSLERCPRNKLKQFDLEVTKKTLLTDTIARIRAADERINYKKIFIDDGGLGAGVYDVLLTDDRRKRKVVAINNATRSINREGTRNKRILKNDLYANTLRLMQEGKLQLWDTPEIKLSLSSVQYELSEQGIRIFGKYTHITEALIRAAWCVTDKRNAIWIRTGPNDSWR